MNAPDSASTLELSAATDDLPLTTRRRPTRAAQARAAAAAQTTTPVAEIDVPAAPAPVGETPARAPRTRGRGPRQHREAQGPASPPVEIEAAAAAPVQPREAIEVEEAPRAPREPFERFDRQPREGDRPMRERHQQRHRDNRGGREQRGRDNREQREQRPPADQRQQGRMGGGFREDNRGNRATERELRELKEAREFAEAMMAEQGIEPNAVMPDIDLAQLPGMDITELYELARQLNIFNYRRLRKQELIYRIMQTQSDKSIPLFAKGVLEIVPEGFGFLRVAEDFAPSPDDIYVSQTLIRRSDLWSGDVVTGQLRPPKEGEKYFTLIKPESVNGYSADITSRRIPFDNLTPIYPCERLKLETTATNLSMRLMDLFNPLGKGQRALIVSPPKAGKTTLLKQVANSISENHPEVTLIALLIDERPEEVTDMQRSINGEVVASTFDELPENHIRCAELVMEKAKRQVEHGKDVVILLDSITRLARAYNSAMPPSGRTLSGGLDPNAMHKPKRFFGAARKLENSGSLTIIATALIDTGSRMDEVIYEEFKGTGNSELTLDRRLADRRIFPAIDIKRSSTRKDELLLTPEEIRKQRILRKTMDAGDTAEVTEFLADRLSRTKSNAEFLMAISDS